MGRASHPYARLLLGCLRLRHHRPRNSPTRIDLRRNLREPRRAGGRGPARAHGRSRRAIRSKRGRQARRGRRSGWRRKEVRTPARCRRRPSRRRRFSRRVLSRPRAAGRAFQRHPSSGLSWDRAVVWRAQGPITRRETKSGTAKPITGSSAFPRSRSHVHALRSSRCAAGSPTSICSTSLDHPRNEPKEMLHQTCSCMRL